MGDNDCAVKNGLRHRNDRVPISVQKDIGAKQNNKPGASGAIENGIAGNRVSATSSAQVEELAVIRCLLNKDAEASDLWAYSDFLKLYRLEIQSLKPQHAPRDSSRIAAQKQRLHAAKDYKDLILIVETLAQSDSSRRPHVRDELRKEANFEHCNDATLNTSIDLALRLWLMLNVRKNRASRPSTVAIQWTDDDTLSDFVRQLFPESNEPMTSNSSHRVDADFTAMGLRDYRNIKIVWTSSLEDHLRLQYDRGKKKMKCFIFPRRESKTRLRVFPYKRALINHLESGYVSPIWRFSMNESISNSACRRTVYSKAVLKEAIWTLDLLFPMEDIETSNFLVKEGQIFQDVAFSEFPPPGFHRYRHWRARLVELHDEFHAPPQTLGAALKDRRNIILWYTFWLGVAIAFMTLAFGLVSSVLTWLILKNTWSNNGSG